MKAVILAGGRPAPASAGHRRAVGAAANLPTGPSRRTHTPPLACSPPADLSGSRVAPLGCPLVLGLHAALALAGPALRSIHAVRALDVGGLDELLDSSLMRASSGFIRSSNCAVTAWNSGTSRLASVCQGLRPRVPREGVRPRVVKKRRSCRGVNGVRWRLQMCQRPKSVWLIASATFRLTRCLLMCCQRYKHFWEPVVAESIERNPRLRFARKSQRCSGG